jgi:hypothetical protein
MNAKRAKELFSEYREGTLSEALKQTLEREFAAQPHLKAEYEEFCFSVDSLELLKERKVETPDELFGIVQDRLNNIDQSARSVARPGVFGSWQKLVIGGACAAAVFGIWFVSGGDNSLAGIWGGKSPIGVSSSNPQLEFVNGELRLVTESAQTLEFKVSSGETGEVFDSVVSSNTKLDRAVRNPRPEPLHYKIAFEGGPADIEVVVPGTSRQASAEGTGALIDFVKVASVVLGAPIQIDLINQDRQVSWSIPETDVENGIIEFLQSEGISSEKRENGLWFLSEDQQ